jgi:hypothetical protein
MAVADAANSLVGNANLISKVYFPRIIVPIAAVIVAFVDFLISFAILVILLVWYLFMPGWQILLSPVFVGIAFMAILGVGVWITALNVKYRDFRSFRYCAVGPLCVSGWIQLRHHTGSVASCLFPQSDGRRHRRISLVPAGKRKSALLAWGRAQSRHQRFCIMARPPAI